MQLIEDIDIRHFHLFCGLGGGALGFNRGRAEVGNLRGKFRCIGGVDVSPAAIRDFNRLSGTRGTVLDMFDREQYVAFHGKQPPVDWKEATPDDIRRAAGNEFPHIVFLSAPCKGFSGLLSESRSKTGKYQALNRLTLRGVWLTMEAFRVNLPELIIFENVPRIATRGRHLLDQIVSMLRSYGYAVAETFHDCGEVGGLAQSRKRFLLVARLESKVPAFLYEPEKRTLRGVGEILERLPMPGDLRGGAMHMLPNLQWKTWVRLAFVQAGSDWRSLKRLQVNDGKLADYLLMRESPWEGSGRLGVTPWQHPCTTVAGASRPENGAFSVADPRMDNLQALALGVQAWESPSGAIIGESYPSNGRFAVADPRFQGGGDYSQYGVLNWGDTAGTVTGQGAPGQGPISIADPRLRTEESGPRYNNIYRVVRWTEPSAAITGGAGPSAAGLSVSDPRPPAGPMFSKYAVTSWDRNSGTVIGGDDQGAYAVADPRPDWEKRYNNLAVMDWEKPSNTVIAGGKGVQGGWMSVADPRVGMDREKGDNYLTGGHYGVLGWEHTSGAVSAAANLDNGRWSVADPRIPEPNQKLVAVIRAEDGTWHRPFTTLELAALQSLVDTDDIIDLDGSSDSAKRERIGNAVPPGAAQAIADLMGRTLLGAWSGETFRLSSTPIWVRDIAVALSVKTGGAA